MKRTLAVFAIGLLFLASMLRSTDGRPSLPLDDSFIYFQYAKQAASGHPFVYQTGEAPTTGCTSLPWMLILSVGSLLGFHGKAIVFFAMICGGALLSLVAKWAGDAERTIRSSGAGEAPTVFGGALATALVLVSGPLAWGAWSGMEIAVFAAAIALALREWARADGRPGRRPALALMAVAVTRPEGAVLAAVAVAAWGWLAWRAREHRRALIWTLLVVAAIGVQPVTNWLLTGDVRSSGYVVKSLLARPGAETLDVLRIAALRAANLGGALLGGRSPYVDGQGLYAYQSEAAAFFVAPGAWILFLVGALPALANEWRERRVGVGILGVAWIVALVGATCVLEEPDAHFNRYQIPILPVFLTFVAVGVSRIGAALRDARGGLALVSSGLRIALLAFGAVSLVFFALAFGDNCEDIDRMQIALAEEIARSLEPDDVVAINDAGALAYFSRRRTVDLVGLTTPGFAGLWGLGSAAIWEKLESMPDAERPDWFCVFPNWFDFDAIGLLHRKGAVRLLTPSIVDAEMVLYRADWSLAGSGDRPRFSGGAFEARVRDAIDVADVESERAHGFEAFDGQHGGSAGTFLHRAGGAGGGPGEVEIVDGGRTVLEEVRFRIDRDPFATTSLVVRTVTGARQRVSVSIDSAAPTEVELYAPGAGRFHEQWLAAIPPGAAPASVCIRVSPEPASSAPLLLAHVFCLDGAP